jgi:hypothetical protein
VPRRDVEEEQRAMQKNTWLSGSGLLLLFLGVVGLFPWAFRQFPPKTFMQISYEELGYGLSRFIPGLLCNCAGLGLFFRGGGELPRWFGQLPALIQLPLVVICLLLVLIGMLSLFVVGLVVVVALVVLLVAVVVFLRMHGIEVHPIP